MRKVGNGSGKVSALLLFALFVMALALALVAGTQVYGALATMQDQVRGQRLSDNLVVNAVRACDAVDAVAQTEGPEGPALVLVERSDVGVFQTRFFLNDGQLWQQYCGADAPLSTDGATAVVATAEFGFFFEDGLLTVATDQGSACIALHSAQGEVVGRG